MQRLLPILLAVLIATPAHAVKVADITRLSGQRSNTLTGLGLVVGLRGTGDGGDFLPAIRPLAAMLGKFADPATVRELAAAQNVAVVMVTATVPNNGVHAGDRIDAYVSCIGAAKSLRGGRLFITPLQGPTPDSGLFATAEGAVTIEDPSTPTAGTVKQGGTMEVEMTATTYDRQAGTFTLILEDPAAGWVTASTIAKIINDAADTTGEELAVVRDPKTVDVRIPQIERARPDSFIARVQQYPVNLQPTEARVQINEKTGTLIVTGDVEISPVVISHRGLTISTVNPAPVPSARVPVVDTKEAVALDTTAQGGAKLQDLVNALDQLKVPAEDRIIIIKELYKTGKLHAKLLVE